MKKFLTLSLVVLFITVISPLYAADPTTSIVVYVKTPDSLPVEGINTSISKDSFSDASVTDIHGKITFDLSSEGAGTYSVSISLDGTNYELTTGEQSSKSVEIAEDEQKAVYFGIKEKVNTGETPEEETTKITIPSSFFASGSETTDLSNKTDNQLKSVSDFTIHKPDLAKIKFKTSLDLSSDTIKNKLNSLDQYVFIEFPGEVSLASDLIPELNKPATITLEGLNFVQLSSGYTPKIMKDDFDAEDSVSNVSLVNGEKITFDVTEFSTYSVRPTFEFEEKEIETEETSYTLKGKIDDLDSEISVYLNDESQDIEVEINDKGEFEIPIELTEKENVVQVLAVGVSEQTYSEVVKITNPNLEEADDNDTKGGGINFTLVFGILLLALVAGGAGGYYYYNKRQKQKTSGKPKQYDSRLLTPEERKTLATNTDKTDRKINAKEEKPKQAPKL